MPRNWNNRYQRRYQEIFRSAGSFGGSREIKLYVIERIRVRYSSFKLFSRE